MEPKANGEARYLALDPGDSTGFAMFDSGGNLVGQGVTTNFDGRDGLYTKLADWHRLETLSTVICEDFFLFPWKSKEQSWDPLNTARIIGVIEYWCHLTHRTLEMQPANIKTIAYKWAGIPVPKTKALTHATDAYVHGVYYLQKNGIRKPQQGGSK